MAGRLNAITVIPMGGHMKDDKEEMKEPAKHDEESEDGLRETFDEFKTAMDAGDDDAAFEAFKSFVEQCGMKDY